MQTDAAVLPEKRCFARDELVWVLQVFEPQGQSDFVSAFVLSAPQADAVPDEHVSAALPYRSVQVF